MWRILQTNGYTKMLLRTTCVCILIEAFITVTFSQTVILHPTSIEVVENETRTLYCSSVSKSSVSYWYSTGFTGNCTDPNRKTLVGYHANGNCTKTSCLIDEIKYKTACIENGSFSVTLKQIDRNQHGHKWWCSQNFTNSSKSIIIVLVPVESVTITSKQGAAIEMCENETMQIKCQTSEARPIPNITWVFQNTFSPKEYFESAGKVLVTNNSDLFVTNSTLDYRPNKTLNNWNIFCKTTNIPGKNVISEPKQMNILYPPEKPPMIKNPNIEHGGTYKVIENHEGNLTCVVTGGNPSVDLKWTCFNSSLNAINLPNTVSKSVVWTASRTDTKACECVAEHKCNSWRKQVDVEIKVLYPPIVQKMDNISLTEGYALKRSCPTMTGIPEKTLFLWTRGKDAFTSHFQVLSIHRVTRHDMSDYKCTVKNKMTPTVGKEEEGSHSGFFYLDVLYPATVDELQNITLAEGDDINITCPVIPGNPQNTYVTWTKGVSTVSDNSTLYKPNISRDDEGIFTCSVTTKLEPTNGFVEDKVNHGNFHLDVVYKAAVIQFHVEDRILEENVTVNETEDVTFLCSTESDPRANVSLSQDGKTAQIFLNKTFRITKKNIQCNESGVYMCSAINEYNTGVPSAKSLQLNVNCSPRPSPSVVLNERVVSARNTRTTLYFTAQAYPEPGSSGFIWNNWNGSAAVPVINKSNIAISSSKLQSNLTIKNVTTSDYGQYLLKITNSIGVFEQIFSLEAYDVPEPPIILSWIASETSIALNIKAGFSGGFPQWFTIRYTEDENENWIVKSLTGIISKLFTYTIVGLSSGTKYKVVIYAANELGNSSDVKTVAKTKVLPKEEEKLNVTGIAIGSVLGVILISLGIFLGIWIYRKRHGNTTEKLIYQNMPFSGRSTKLKKKSRTSFIRETSFECLQEIDDVPKVQSERTEYYNSLDKIEKIDRIKVQELFPYVLDKDEDEFAIEYQKLPTELQKPCTFARKPENIALNRYNGIFPYDHSRVKIHGQPNFFINACYIDGYGRHNAYIASLGPTAKTTGDFETFWQMIWHERSDVIVMLTNLREPSGMKCEQYWPMAKASLSYGDICVSSQKTDVFAEYTVRTFTIIKDDERRSLTHLHYTAWPDKTIPEDVTSLIEFRQRMKSTSTTSEGPIVVHCSAGIGRTGTLIALDRLIQEGQDTGSINVFECVNSMREQRVKMVQTLEQYIYIYKALVNALTFDGEAIPTETFCEYVETTNNNMYSRLFQQLRQSVETDIKEEIEARSKNKSFTDKNRHGADIPGNRFRVFLYISRENGESDYANAVYMNSFKKKDFFIVAQTPLPSTVADFIGMIYQEECSCIVSMDDLNESATSVGKYLLDDKQMLTSGSFNVSCSILETNQQYVLRRLKIKYEGKFDSGEKSVFHFQYTKWMTGNETPANAREFVQFVNEVGEYGNELGSDRSHVLVHCLKANERSGLFCAVSVLMEKLKFERQASVSNTLRHCRTRRRSAITSMEQLRFCYQAASAYTKMIRA